MGRICSAELLYVNGEQSKGTGGLTNSAGYYHRPINGSSPIKRGFLHDDDDDYILTARQDVPSWDSHCNKMHVQDSGVTCFNFLKAESKTVPDHQRSL